MILIRRTLVHSLAAMLGAGLMSWSTPAVAAFGNYNSILIGDQAAGMGGAYTAMNKDVSALAYYNPASLAFLEGHSFSAAVGIYKKFDTKFGEEEAYTKAPLRMNQGFFRAIPSSTGNVVRKGDYTFGFSIVVPDFDSFKGDLKSTSGNTTTLSYVDESLWVGGAVSTKISENESLGMTLYYTARSYSRSLSDRSFPDASNVILYNSEKVLTENALVPVLGYFRRLDDKWKMGLSLRLPSQTIKGSGSYFESYVQTNPYQVTSTTRPGESTNVKIPGKITLGFSYEYSPDFIIAADGSLYQSVTYDDFADESYATHNVHRAIWNGSLGMEGRLYPWLKARIGFFTNFSSHPDPDPYRSQQQPDKVDQLGFSANLAFISDDKIEYTFGGYYTGGRGRSIQRIDQQTEVIVVTQHVFTMLVGTAFSF